MANSFNTANLSSRSLIRVVGEAWRSFLQGLITNDVETLQPGDLRFAALLTPQGRFLFEMFVFGMQDGCLLDVEADRRDALIQRLTIYRLRAKVEIAATEGTVSALWSNDPAAAAPNVGWRPDPRLPAMGWRGVDAAAPAGAIAASQTDYDARRLALGLPDPARDLTADKTYPIEANLDLLHAIDFKKGCYVGQETTSRMKRRGVIRSRMLPITYEGAPPPFGAEVLAGELRAGEVLSGADGRAMALLRLDRIEGAALSVDGRPVAAATPDWM